MSMLPLIYFSFCTAIVYTLVVYTGGVRYAGTDARIFVTLVGDRTKSFENKLNTSRSEMEENSYAKQSFYALMFECKCELFIEIDIQAK